MIEKYSIRLFKPDWPNWLIWFVDEILMLLPLLKMRKANQILRKLKTFDGPLFVEMLSYTLGINVNVRGTWHIPKQGAAIVVCNHPGKADIIAMLNALTEHVRREDTVILANKFICVKNVQQHLIPVDTFAPKGKKVPMEQVEQALRDGKVLVIFPYGLDSRYDEEGRLRDLDWKATFIDLAKKFEVPVIISHIDGTQNSELFHKAARFRKKISWLQNVPLELSFLLREMVLAKGDVTIRFTKPLSPDFLKEHVKTNADKQRMAEIMRKFCYRIPCSKEQLSFVDDHYYV